jgi:hypothetical protein
VSADVLRFYAGSCARQDISPFARWPGSPGAADKLNLHGCDGAVGRPSYPSAMYVSMSYILVLECGCTVYVSHDALTNAQHSRVLERRGPSCPIAEHRIGARVFRHDLLPDRERQSRLAAGGERSPD